MKVLGGEFQGRSLKAPGGSRELRAAEGARPMTEMVKQALFNVLGDVTGLRVLDLFAGSGQLGIEALSRGAAFAAFVEVEKRHAGCVRENLKAVGAGSEIARVLVMDVLRYLPGTKSEFDLIFADPPYEKNLVNVAFTAVESALKPGGRLVLRHSKHEPLVTRPDCVVENEFSRKYGDDVLTIWRK
ncbi:16S rRNA (guanine(966)-N(2))-methyltransferase RsmD [bacterium]|nr:16S rRNA (guanine(966)-N(2))-methyltransferase RsmD [bacterium]